MLGRREQPPRSGGPSSLTTPLSGRTAVRAGRTRLEDELNEDEQGCLSHLITHVWLLTLVLLVLALGAAAGVFVVLWRRSVANQRVDDFGDETVRRALNGLFYSSNPSGTDWSRCNSKDSAGALWASLTHYCTWKCVQCSASRDVIALHLQDAGLAGSVSALVGQLRDLQTLDVGGNDELKGTLPSSLSKLTALTTLRLNHTQISGSLPADMANLIRLEELNAANARLTGVLPAKLAKLRLLDLRANEVSGTLSAWPAADVQLQYNHLSGDLPHGRLPEFPGTNPTIDVAFNNFSGFLPPAFDPALRVLKMSCAPAVHGSTTSCLSGTLPTTLGELSYLEHLQLENNHLSGTIPTELGGLKALKFIFLQENDLTGVMPEEFADILRGLDDSTCNVDDNCLEMPEKHLCSSQQRTDCSE